jgi:hypothetical protein
MLRGSLALSRPLIAAYLPGYFRRGAGLFHVFAKRTGGDHSKVSVGDDPKMDGGDLKRVIMADLKMTDVSPDRVRLLLEVDGGLPLPVTSRKRLSEEGVRDGSSLLVEVIPDPPNTAGAFASGQDVASDHRLRATALPPPLAFTPLTLGGVPMMAANGPSGHPFFLQSGEVAALMAFINRHPAFEDNPNMLMLTGTIKSGKTTLLHSIIPGLLASRFQGPPRNHTPSIYFFLQLSPRSNRPARCTAHGQCPANLCPAPWCAPGSATSAGGPGALCFPWPDT